MFEANWRGTARCVLRPLLRGTQQRGQWNADALSNSANLVSSLIDYVSFPELDFHLNLVEEVTHIRGR